MSFSLGNITNALVGGVFDFLGGTDKNDRLDNLSSSYQPYNKLGIDSLEMLQKLQFGNATDVQNALNSTPGYASSLEAGQNGINQMFTSMGLGNSSGLMKGMADYNVGQAQQGYQSLVNMHSNNVNNGMGALNQISGFQGQQGNPLLSGIGTGLGIYNYNKKSQQPLGAGVSNMGVA